MHRNLALLALALAGLFTTTAAGGNPPAWRSFLHGLADSGGVSLNILESESLGRYSFSFSLSTRTRKSCTAP